MQGESRKERRRGWSYPPAPWRWFFAEGCQGLLPNHQDNAEHTCFLVCGLGDHNLNLHLSLLLGRGSTQSIDWCQCELWWPNNCTLDTSHPKKTHPMQFYYTNNLHTAWNIPLFLSKHPKNESALPHVNAMLGIPTSETGNRWADKTVNLYAIELQEIYLVDINRADRTNLTQLGLDLEQLPTPAANNNYN